jgi:hypothetical protein
MEEVGRRGDELADEQINSPLQRRAFPARLPWHTRARKPATAGAGNAEKNDRLVPAGRGGRNCNPWLLFCLRENDPFKL